MKNSFLSIFVLLILGCGSSSTYVATDVNLNNLRYVYIEPFDNLYPDEDQLKVVAMISELFAKKGLKVLTKSEYESASKNRESHSFITLVKFYYEIKSRKIGRNPEYEYSLPSVKLNMFDLANNEIYSGKGVYSGIGSKESILKIALENAFTEFDKKFNTVKPDTKINP